MTATALAGMAATAGALGALLLGGAAARRAGCHPEITRKAVHVGMGTVALFFPWLFDSPAPVIALAVGALAILLPLRFVPAWHARAGCAVGDVARASCGELCFPVAVAATFVLARGDAVAYVIPVAILTFADTAAALVGLRLGRVRYTTDEGTKTVEGSLAFFGVAFAATAVGLALGTDAGPGAIARCAATLGLLAMAIEASSRFGLDNLLLPVGSHLCLADLRTMPAGMQFGALAVMAGLLAVVIVWRRRATLNDAALLAAAVYGYVAWSLGGPAWVVAPLLLFFAYPLLAPSTPVTGQRIHAVPVILSVIGTGLAWLLAARLLERPELRYPYTLAFAAHLAITCLVRAAARRPDAGTWHVTAAAALPAWALSLGAFAVGEAPARAAVAAAVALPLVVGGTCLFAAFQQRLPAYPVDRPRWLRQAAVAALVSVGGLPPLRWWM